MPLVLLVLLCLAGPAFGVTVNAAHPRLISPSEVAAIRAAAATGNAGRLAALKAVVDAGSNMTNPALLSCTAGYRFYSGTTNPTYINGAITCFINAVNAQTFRPTSECEGELTGGVNTLAFALDVLYDDLVTAGRQDIIALAAQQLALAQNCSWGGDTHGQAWKARHNRLACFLVASGHTGVPATETIIQNGINEYATFLDVASIDCLNLVSPFGEWEDYDGYGVTNWLENYDAMKNGTDWVAPADIGIVQSGWLYWLMQQRTGLLTFTESGQTRSYVMHDFPASKINAKFADQLVLVSWWAHQGNPYAQNLALYMRSQGYNFQSNKSETPAWISILQNLTSTDAGTDWTTAPKEIWNPQRALYSGVQAHQLGASATRIKFQFAGGIGEFSDQANAGHFQISRADANGYWRAGYRVPTDYDGYNGGLEARNDNRNCIIIRRAGEVPGAPSWTWAAKGASSNCSTGSDTMIVRDRGFQTHGDPVKGAQKWPACVWDPPGSEGPESAPQRGEVVRFASDDEFMQAAVTFDDCYSATKQQGVSRAVVWMKLPETIGQGFWIVWDRAEVLAGTSKVMSYLHTPNAPHANGSITRLWGAGNVNPDSIVCDFDGPLTPPQPALDLHGGVYRSTNSTKVWNDDATSRFCLYPLSATDQLGASAKLNIIGGPNALHQHWKQTWIPCYLSTYATTNAGGGWSSFEFWYGGKNWVPGSYANICQQINCANSTTIWAYKSGGTSVQFNPLFRNAPPYPVGNGGKACDWHMEYGFDDLSIASGVDRVDLVYGIWAGPQTVVPGSLPEMRGVVSGDIAAASYKPSGGAAAVMVFPAPDVGARLTSVTYTNPLFGSSETGSQIHRITWLGEDRTWEVLADDVSLGTAQSDENGTLAYSIPATAEEITIEPSGIVSGPTVVSCNATVLGAPRLRHVLQAGGGTLLALTAQQSGLGYVIQATISRDDGQTWRDLDGVQGSVTQLWPDEEAVGPNIFAPRADKGFGAAIDPTTNDLTILCPTERYNASYILQATVPRVMRWLWTGSTWDYATADYSQTTGAEGGATLHPRDCTVLISRAHQAFFSWVGPSGASWAVHSSRLKASTQASMSSGAALFSSQQTPQLMEWPAGTIWQVTMVQPNSGVNDSIRVRTATDGGSAQWGATSRIAGTQQVAAGDFSATVGPSGPTCVVLSGSPIAATLRYWTGSAWATTTSDLGLSVVATASDPLLLTAGVTRVYLATHYLPSGLGGVLSTWWSLSDGWAGWRSDWAGEDVATVHGVMLRPTEGLLFACASALDGVPGTASLDTQRFSLPPETEPTGACCAGACSVLTYAECVDLGGAWQGPDVPCSPDPCISPPEVGACCYPDGSCVVTAETGCGGTYQGDRTECSPNPCPAGPPSLAGRRRRILTAAR